MAIQTLSAKEKKDEGIAINDSGCRQGVSKIKKIIGLQ